MYFTDMVNQKYNKYLFFQEWKLRDFNVLNSICLGELNTIKSIAM